MTYIPYLITGLIVLVIGVIALTKLQERGVTSPLRYLTLLPGLLLVLVFGYFVYQTRQVPVEEYRPIAQGEMEESTNNEEEAVDETTAPNTTESDSEEVESTRRLTNDFLMLHSPREIYDEYSEVGQERLDDFFLMDNLSKDFALTLIGKELDQTIDTTTNLTAHLNRERYIIAVLNQGEYSKEVVEKLNATDYQDGVHYLAYFPMDDPETVDAFYEETGLDEQWVPIAEQVELAVDELNVVGTPTFIALDKGVISLAITNFDLYEDFLNEAFTQPALYTLIKPGN